MWEAKNSDYFGKSPFDDLKNVTNTVMDVIKQGREKKLAIARATFEVSAKQQEDLKNQQSEDSADDMKAEREKKEKERERKRAAASRQTDAYRGIEKGSGKSLHPESAVKEAKDTDPDTKGTQGDDAKWKKARSEVLKKYGVPSCASIKDDKTKKQCFKDLDDSHVADHEEQTKKEEAGVDARTKGYKDTISRILGKKIKEVKEICFTVPYIRAFKILFVEFCKIYI